MLHRLEKEPLIVIPTDARVPILISTTVIKALAFSSMYFPGTAFPILALVINLLYLRVELGPLIHYPDLYGMCGPAPKEQMYPEDSGVAIGCIDWQGLGNLTMSEYKKLLDESQKLSWFGDVVSARSLDLNPQTNVQYDLANLPNSQFMVVNTRCAGYTIPPHDPPAMNWTAFPRGRLDEKSAIRTAYPMLFVSTTYDPVTPLRQALLMSTRFSNSSVVEQRSEGHCSLSSLSFCTLRHIKAYLNEGKLPKRPRLDEGGEDHEMLTGEWETCEADEKPWKPYRPPLRASNVDMRVQEEMKMAKAVQTVQKASRDEGWWDFQRNRHGGGESPLQELLKMDYEVLQQLVRSQQDASVRLLSHGHEGQKVLSKGSRDGEL